MSRALRLTAAAALLVFAVPRADAQIPAAPAFMIEAVWSGDMEPGAMWIERGPVRVDLTRSGQAFTGRTPIGGRRTTERATLIAAFGGETVTLPIRFVPSDPVMRFNIHAARSQPCMDAVVRRLEQPGSVYSAQVQAYFSAKKLATASGSAACAPNTKARVVRAWFDRSYALARDNAHIAIDSDAAEALKQIPAHRTYAENMERQILTQAFSLDYNALRQMAGDGAYAEALAANVALTRELEADPDLARSVAEVQRVDAERLALDRSFLEARVEVAAAAAAAAEPGAAEAAPPPETSGPQ